MPLLQKERNICTTPRNLPSLLAPTPSRRKECSKRSYKSFATSTGGICQSTGQRKRDLITILVSQPLLPSMDSPLRHPRTIADPPKKPKILLPISPLTISLPPNPPRPSHITTFLHLHLLLHYQSPLLLVSS